MNTDNRTSRSMRTKVAGFTLIEVMIVVAIVAILAALAVPMYQNQVIRTHRTDAMGALLGLGQAMERYFAQNNTYESAAAGGADTGAPAIFPTQSPIDGGVARYNLTISAANATSYTLRATPIAGGAQAGDGFVELTSLGQRNWDQDNSGAIGVGENTWKK